MFAFVVLVFIIFFLAETFVFSKDAVVFIVSQADQTFGAIFKFNNFGDDHFRFLLIGCDQHAIVLIFESKVIGENKGVFLACFAVDHRDDAVAMLMVVVMAAATGIIGTIDAAVRTAVTTTICTSAVRAAVSKIHFFKQHSYFLLGESAAQAIHEHRCGN